MSWYHLVLRQVHEFKNVISSSFRSLVFLLLHWSDLREGGEKDNRLFLISHLLFVQNIGFSDTFVRPHGSSTHLVAVHLR